MMPETARRTPSVYEASYRETAPHNKTEIIWTLRRAAGFMLVASAVLWGAIFFVISELIY